MNHCHAFIEGLNEQIQTFVFHWGCPITSPSIVFEFHYHSQKVIGSLEFCTDIFRQFLKAKPKRFRSSCIEACSVHRFVFVSTNKGDWVLFLLEGHWQWYMMQVSHMYIYIYMTFALLHLLSADLTTLLCFSSTFQLSILSEVYYLNF